MPVIRIDFDNEKVSDAEVKALCEAAHTIVLEASGTDDVPVFANSPQLSANMHPVEIFVQMSAHKIKDLDALVADIKSRLATWKQQTSFPHPINFTFIPMDWKIEIGI